MAVAAAPCEERDGLRRTGGRPLSVLPVLLARAAFGSPDFQAVCKEQLSRPAIQRTSRPGRTSKCSRGGPRRRGPRPRPAPLEVTPVRARPLVPCLAPLFGGPQA